MKKIALAMITKNEAEKLRRCLESAKNYVDEIVVVDTGSEDNSVDVAKEFTDKVYDFQWIDDFSAARNAAVEKVESDYVLVLDSDEWIEEMDLENIQNMIENNVLGEILIKNILDPDKNGVEKIAESRIVRFFPKTERYIGKIHEQVNSKLKTVELPIVVLHDGYQNRSEVKINRNMKLLKNELKRDKLNPYYNYQIGKEYKVLNDYENAVRYFGNAYKNADRRVAYFPRLVCEYMDCLHECGKMTECLNLIEKERSKFMDYPDFLFNSAAFYLDLIMSDIQKYIGYLGLIETNYQTCIELGENNKYDGISGTGSYMAMHNLGAFYESLGNNEDAVQCYKMAAEYDYEPSVNRLKALGIK